jgi:hypothetical protein
MSDEKFPSNALTVPRNSQPSAWLGFARTAASQRFRAISRSLNM